MRTMRCRVCGERIRKDHIDAHMRAVHRRGGQLRVLPLAIAAMIIVTALAVWLIRLPAPAEENSGGTFDPGAVAVQFNSDDGWAIKGTYYRENESMPVVILAPGVGEGRGAYGPLVEELRAKRYNVLAYDPRGCGESVYQNGRKRVWQDFSDADFQAGTNDVASAWQYALAKFGPPRVAVIGASLGANQALASAASDTAPELKALVLLAPGTDYRGVESAPAIQTLNNRTSRPAIFFAASEDDPANSAQVAQSLNQSYAGRKSLELLAGGAHGTVLLTYPAFRTEIIQYLDDVFKS
jgi:pimeloyl-ACP methyl ester carboxylesterase